MCRLFNQVAQNDQFWERRAKRELRIKSKLDQVSWREVYFQLHQWHSMFDFYSIDMTPPIANPENTKEFDFYFKITVVGSTGAGI